MKKGDEVLIRFDRLKKLNTAEGYPITEEENPPKVIVKNAYPGEEVKVRITKKRKNKIEGRITEVLSESEMPVCGAFNKCGGCLYLGIAREKEADIKNNYLKELFEGYPYQGLTRSPNENYYRNKMEYSFGDAEKDGDLTLGLHQRNSFYNVINTDDCYLAPKEFEIIRKAILDYFLNQDVSYFHKNTHKGFLRHLVLKKGAKTGEILVNLVTSSEQELDKEAFVDMLNTLDLGESKITGIIHTINDSPADAVIPEKVEVLYGEPIIKDSILDIEFEITPFSFFQVNTLGADILFDIVRKYAKEVVNKEDNIIYDLYSGTGTISLILADLASKVIGIEVVEEATEIAKENAKNNGIDNAYFIAGDVLEEAENLIERPDLIILDPPRSGIHPKAMKKILDLDPPAYIYVSCNPESLKRDLPFFENRGYKVKKMESVDMFPLTPNVETVALLQKN